MKKGRLSQPFRFGLKVYLEDTDAQGLVYHANYLRFMERARSDLLESLGFSPHPEPGQLRFVVHRVDIKFLRPARAGQQLEVLSYVRPASEYRLQFRQRVFPSGRQKALAEATVDVVALDDADTLSEIPSRLADALAGGDIDDENGHVPPGGTGAQRGR